MRMARYDSKGVIEAPCIARGKHVSQLETPSNDLSTALANGLNRAYLVALRMTRDPGLAEDAVQEAYANLLRRQPKVLSEPQWIVYLCKAVRNSVFSLHRSANVRQRHEGNYRMNANDTASSAPEILAADELKSAARTALERLPDGEREAVSLCCEQGLTWQQAAEILEVPKQTLGDRLEKGLERLRSQLALQGFALATPLAMGAALKTLGMPLPPSSLALSTAKLAAAHQPLLAVGGTAKVVASQSAWGLTPAALSWVLLMATAGGGLWWWRSGVQGVSPADSAAALKTEPPVPAQEEARAAQRPTTLVREPAVLWSDDFSNLKHWRVPEGHRADQMEWRTDGDLGRMGRPCLRLRYTYLDAPETTQVSKFRANHRSIEQALRVPERATHLRIWARRVSGKDQAQVYFHFSTHDSLQSWSAVLKVAPLTGEWRLFEFDLRRMPEYWSRATGFVEGAAPVPVDPRAVTEFQIGANHGDLDVCLDGLELISREVGLPSATGAGGAEPEF